MTDCIICGKKIGFFDVGTQRRCGDCTAVARLALLDEDESDTSREVRLKEETRSREINDVLLTTETALNLNIIQRIEIVTAECAFGMNIFKDLFAGVRDIVGGRSEAVQKTMRDARKTALYELKREAHLVGANAVIGVDLDYVELSNVGSMIMLVASGTAVIIEEQIT